MFETLLEKIAIALDKTRVPYMVIGGQAVLVHGEPRLTRDIDVTLGVSLDRLDEVVETVEGLGFELLADPHEFTLETMVLPCLDPATRIRIDLIFSFSPYESQAIDRAHAVRVGGADVRFASPEDLIIHKIVAGRPRDLEDVRAILLKNPDLDRKWILRWLKEFETSLEEPFCARFDELER